MFKILKNCRRIFQIEFDSIKESEDFFKLLINLKFNWISHVPVNEDYKKTIAITNRNSKKFKISINSRNGEFLISYLCEHHYSEEYNSKILFNYKENKVKLHKFFEEYDRM